MQSLETKYAVLLRLIGKPVVDFLLVIIEHQYNIDWKLAFLKGGSVGPKSHIEGVVPYQPFFVSGKLEWSIFHTV